MKTKFLIHITQDPRATLEDCNWYIRKGDKPALAFMESFKNRCGFGFYGGKAFGEFSSNISCWGIFRRETEWILAHQNSVEKYFTNWIKQKYQVGDNVECLGNGDLEEITEIKLEFLWGKKKNGSVAIWVNTDARVMGQACIFKYDGTSFAWAKNLTR